ncbi:MAG TPA: hypothetical protein PKD85_14295 [Saprospiraceae bacterium]|nr:hypothetical protein [Saprospiraceae bacterium]
MKINSGSLNLKEEDTTYMDFNLKYVLELALESPEFLVLRFGYIISNVE